MNSSEPRALLVAPTPPADTGNGLAIRLGVFAEALARVCRTDLLYVPMFGVPADPGWAGRFGIRTEIVETAGREDTQYRLLSRLADPAARLDRFRRYGRTSLAARLSQPVLQEIRRRASGADYALVHVGRSYMLEAGVAVGGAARLSADLDEDDAWAWRSLAAIRQTPEQAAWDRAEAMAADANLRRLHGRYDALFIASPVDGRRLARRHAGTRPFVLPNPAPAAPAPPRLGDGRTLMFVGSFGYAPNVDGIAWFIADAWPRIRQRRPDARLRLVGRDLPARLAALDEYQGIEAIGAVDDLLPLYSTSDIAIAPLRAGGGTRIKLIEAAAFGVPMVATPTAAAGLPFGNAQAMWLAASAEAFANAVVAASDNAAERTARAAKAQAIVRRSYARHMIVEQLACRFAAILAR